jgi:hypothetical protein
MGLENIEFENKIIEMVKFNIIIETAIETFLTNNFISLN